MKSRFNNILETVGRTPVVRLCKLAQAGDLRVVVMAEAFGIERR